MNTTTKTRKNPFRLAFLGAVMALYSITGHAFVLTEGDTGNFSWSQNTADGILSGTGSITATGLNSGSLTLAITLNNTSADSTDRLTAFGFGIDPNASSVSFFDPQGSDGGMINAVLGATFPSIQNIETCAFGGPTCAGGGNGGLDGGSSDIFNLILAGTWGTSVNIDPIGFKYQTSGDSYEFTTSSTSTSTSTGGGPIPEPGSLSLLGLGLIVYVFSLRRRSLQLQA